MGKMDGAYKDVSVNLDVIAELNETEKREAKRIADIAVRQVMDEE